jgi:hypothetical protein
MKHLHQTKGKRNPDQTPIAYLSGMFPVDTDILRETLPDSLLSQRVFCYTVCLNGQDFPFDPDTQSVINSIAQCERVSFSAAVTTLEDGRADGLGIILKKGDGLCIVRLTSDAYFQPHTLPDEIGAIVSNLNTYTVFGLGGQTITILCNAVKPKGFLSTGVLGDGSEILVSDCDCFVSLSGMAFRGEQDIFNRQAEIVKLCEDYVDPRCPIVGVDGALKGIVTAVFAYSDRRGEFNSEWNRRVARQKRVRNRVLPPEFVASMEMVAHLTGVGE